ncbi:hypothetical protein [Aeromonas sp. 600886]|uniref:hypothetical protein n=1 Tax=unclassified Aeromonas TaxID=257493 RepID=UPI003BA0073A
MKLKLLLAATGLAVSAFANCATPAWVPYDDCSLVAAPHVYSDGVATINLTPSGDLWIALPGKVAFVQERKSKEMIRDKVLTINGLKLKAASQYYPDSDLVLIGPYTPEGIKEFRAKMLPGGDVTIKYNHKVIEAKFPPLSEGEKALVDCKKPI